MRHALLLPPLLLAACTLPSAEADERAAEPKDRETELITHELQVMNGDGFGRPADSFRPGSISGRHPPAVKKTAHGFEIRFPNHSPISTPSIYAGKVFTSGGFNSKEFYAFDARTGQGAWGADLSDDGPSASACADGICVFNTESCTTFAVDAQSGQQRWSWYLGDPQTSSPSIAGGRVFTSYPAGATKGGKPRPPRATHVLAAFDLRTGKVQWQDWLDADVISAPVAVGDFVYVATFNGTVIKFEQATGKIRYATRGRATSAPVVQVQAGLESMYYTRRADGQPAPTPGAPARPAAAAAPAAEQIIRTDHNEPETKYVTPPKTATYLDEKVQSHSDHAAAGKAHDAGNGFGAGAPASAAPALAAKNVGAASVETMQHFQGSRILHTAKANVNTMGDEVVATNPEDGSQLWSRKLDGDLAHAGGFLGTAPLAAGGHVVIATLQGKVLELDPTSGKVQATFDVGGPVRAQPVVADGWIYLGTEDGRLVAIDTGDRTLGGWPMWGGDAARTGIAP
jgi:outer membrane protein assembly factor BamB